MYKGSEAGAHTVYDRKSIGTSVARPRKEETSSI
jgi:hypothetical protein